MSNIIIEDKNVNDINQSNFQTVGPYTGDNEVYEPWQGRNIINGEDQDLRFSLGTYTENNREFWEFQTTNPNTRKSQFVNKTIRTARAVISDNNLVISDETDWSVDSFVYSTDEDGKSVPLFFYYDKKLHREEYNVATNGNVNLRIELREDGRDGVGVIDNFLVREPFRPFVLGTNTNSYDDELSPGGYSAGDGAYKYNDAVDVVADPVKISHFVRWTDGISDEEMSMANPYTFNMPRNDLELVANFRLNPKIHIMGKVNGDIENGGELQFFAEYWLGTYMERIINTVEIEKLDTGISQSVQVFDDDGVPPNEEFNSYVYYTPGTSYGGQVRYLEDELQKYRPNDEIQILAKSTGEEFLFNGFTFINQNGVEETIETISASAFQDDASFDFNATLQDLPPAMEDQILPYQFTTSNEPVGVFQLPSVASIDSNPFPDNVIQIYANYTILLYYIRSLNNWFLSENSNQSLFNKQSFILTFGYGDGGPNFRANQLAGSDNVTVNGDGIDWFKMPVESFLSMRIPNLLDNTLPGYDIGEWFWWQNPVSGSSFSHFTIENDKQEFDQAILDSLTDDDVGLDDGVTLRISANNNMMSDVGTQITGTADAFTYIGYKFTQLGPYVKITKTDDSHDFDVVSPPNSYVIRTKENSPELDANMYGIGSTLIWDFTPNMVHQQGEVGEMPEIQSVRGWNDSTKAFQTFPNDEVPSISAVLQTYGITYEQNGESMRLRYPLSDSTEDDLYLKYFEFIVKSTIVPPPIAPFNGVFEVNFISTNDNIATVSFLQEDGDTPQTTLIGQYGEDAGEFGVETPTHAITMDEWIAGATVGILPIPLKINYNPNIDPDDITLTGIVVQYGFSATAEAIDELLEVVQPTNQYNEQTKNNIKESLLGTGNDPYLEFQVTPDSFNIERISSNGFVDEFLRGIEQDNSLPRIPLTVVSAFYAIYTISIQSSNFFVLPDGEYPTRFITNWNQAAYDADNTSAAADTWVDDDLMLIDASEMFTVGDTVNITVPALFFNGGRQLKIRQVIAAQSGASSGPEIIQSGGSATISSNESSTYDWINRITAVNGSLNITLNWVGGF